MTKRQVMQEFKKLKYEIIENKPILKKPYPPSLVRKRELLLFAQVHLCNILEAKAVNDKIKEELNVKIYKSFMTLYYGWEKIKKY